MDVLELKNVFRKFGDTRVLEGVSFKVAPGEVVGLLGRNGAGKTTLIKLVLGMLEADSGTVRVFGEDPRLDPVSIRRRIGYVAEDQEIPPFLKVGQVLTLYRELFPDWNQDDAQELIRRFELPVGRKVSDLSRGQARQVALLCAVSHRPDLLILDEPAGGLDPAARREFLETSIRLLNERGTTILFSSHHMADVERMASRLIMIHENEKWIDSALDDIRDGYCLVQVPAGSATTDSLLKMGDCLCVRTRGTALHAVFAASPEICRVEVSRRLGRREIQCRPLALEEMFIELVGRNA